MKKLILASVFTFVGLTAFGQESEMGMAASQVVQTTQDGFSEITMDNLP